jgi:cytochrome c biogenesis protein CcdA/thiol-disulfide isomerase/thioredoxin
MLLFVVAYLGGVLTIVSPCILPVLPFVFARADQPFVKSGLPLLLGMAITFALVATLAAVGGGWIVQANSYGRLLALGVLGMFGVLLLFPALADRATRPLTALGARLSNAAGGGGSARSVAWASFLLGIATGLLWAPCAGPVLGLVLTGAALEGASVKTTLLLLAYAAGAATSLALALLIGGRLFTAMKRSIRAGETVRRVLGALVIAGVAAISLGLDTGLLTRLSLTGTAGAEQALLDRLPSRPAAATAAAAAAPAPARADLPSAAAAGLRAAAVEAAPVPASTFVSNLPVEGALPSLGGAVQWLNSPPLSAQALRGKVVLVDFWTYSCINCLRTLPYVKAWAAKYKDQGLVVIGVHTPEFAFEKDLGNVRRAVRDLGVAYPVAVDSDRTIWRAFGNQYWPAHYLVDGQGRIRFHHFGEGDEARTEQAIRALLAENHGRPITGAAAAVDARGVGAQADIAAERSPETYVGFAQQANFASPEGAVPYASRDYSPGVAVSRLNRWGLDGRWTIGPESARADTAGGGIVYRFHARDLHLVLGPGPDGRPVRFRVTVDGQAPGADHGVDTDSAGGGVVTQTRLYQLVRQSGEIRDRTFAIEFLDPGVQAYAFTFG